MSCNNTTISAIRLLLLSPFITLLTGCGYISDFYDRWWHNQLTGWEWLLLIVLIILLVVVILLLAGAITIEGIVTGVVAIATLIWEWFILPALTWIRTILHGIFVRGLWARVLLPLWEWFVTTRAGLWLVPILRRIGGWVKAAWDSIGDNALWDGIKWVGAAIVGGIAWLFSDGDESEDEPVKVPCGTRIPISFEVEQTSVQRDYPFGKTEATVKQDAKDEAQRLAKEAAKQALQRAISSISCGPDCPKSVLNESITVDTPSVDNPPTGTVWTTFTGKCKARGSAIVVCGEAE